MTERMVDMDTSLSTQGHTKTSTLLETSLIEKDILAASGFTCEESLSLFWLRQWYQTGGSDRAVVMRHLEFLKMLVATGKIDL